MIFACRERSESRKVYVVIGRPLCFKCHPKGHCSRWRGLGSMWVQIYAQISFTGLSLVGLSTISHLKEVSIAPVDSTAARSCPTCLGIQTCSSVLHSFAHRLRAAAPKCCFRSAFIICRLSGHGLFSPMGGQANLHHFIGLGPK